jgi:hypothetical protein
MWRRVFKLDVIARMICGRSFFPALVVVLNPAPCVANVPGE